MHTRRPLTQLLGAAVAALLLTGALTGCTAPSDEEPGGGPGGESTAESVPGPALTPGTPNTEVVATESFEVTLQDEGVSATATVIVRSVKVDGEAMVVRWAVGWSSDELDPDASFEVDELFGAIVPDTTAVDTHNLVAYKALCTVAAGRTAPSLRSSAAPPPSRPSTTGRIPESSTAACSRGPR